MKEKARKYLKTMEAFTSIYEDMIQMHQLSLKKEEENVKRVAEETDSTTWEYRYYTEEAEKAKIEADAYLAIAEEIIKLMNNTKIGKSN